ncbi:MAG TPA: hypothetical protein VFK40_10570 [Nitrososphaeraceae archaeon]|nr:hypothetical protein [Nitrososphaeraceae archaeon]
MLIFFFLHINKYYVIYSKTDNNSMDLTPPRIAVVDNDEYTLNLYTEVINKFLIISS